MSDGTATLPFEAQRCRSIPVYAPRMRPPRPLHAALAFAAVALSSLAPAPARADLTGDVERLIEKWSARAGTSVERRPPLFLEQGRTTVVRLSGPEKAPAEARPSAACTTVVLLTPRTSEIAFLPDSGGAAALPPPELPIGHPGVARSAGDAIRSKAGVALVERCGKEQTEAPLEAERLLVQSISARTAVDVLVVRSAAPLESVESLLPERAEGPSAPRGDAGRSIDPGPIAERLQRVEKRIHEAGAQRMVKVAMQASAAGTGQFNAKLGEGCHTLDLLAEVPTTFPRRGTDVDVEVRVVEGGRMLARDRGESPDAHVDFCLGEATEVELPFIGASGAVEVTFVDALWPLPPSLPTEWGARARGDIAAALRRRHAPPLPPEAIATVMGVQGETMVPFAVEPGQCYLAVTALVRGDARGLRLAVDIGDRAPHDESTERPEAAQVAFCATVEDVATLRIEARGSQPWWLALVWRVTPL
jgi:hypothetical protein